MWYYYLPKTRIDFIAVALLTVLEQAQSVLSPQDTSLAIFLLNTFLAYIKHQTEKEARN